MTIITFVIYKRVLHAVLLKTVQFHFFSQSFGKTVNYSLVVFFSKKMGEIGTTHILPECTNICHVAT